MIKKQGETGGRLGVAPTQAQKLQYIAQKLGLSGIKGMQGSTVNIVDTVLLSGAAANRQVLSFFANAGNKSRNFSNFQNGTLNAGEAMVIESLTFFLLTLNSTNLTLDSTGITSIRPISQVDAGQVSLKEAFQLGLINITIANSKVVKDYMSYEQNPNFNPKTTGIERGTNDGVIFPEECIGQNTIQLESPPVLPPNQKLEISFEIPPVGVLVGNLAIMCVAGRFGSIFSAKTTL